MSKAILSKLCLPRSSLSVLWANWWWYPRSLIESPVMTAEDGEADHQSLPHLILLQPHLTALVIPFLSQGQRIVAPCQERFWLPGTTLDMRQNSVVKGGKLKTGTSSKHVRFKVMAKCKMGKKRNSEIPSKNVALRRVPGYRGARNASAPLKRRCWCPHWRLETRGHNVFLITINITETEDCFADN